MNNTLLLAIAHEAHIMGRVYNRMGEPEKPSEVCDMINKMVEQKKYQHASVKPVRKPTTKEIWDWAAKVCASQPANTGEDPEIKMNKSHYQSNKEWRHRNPKIRYAGKKRYYQKTQNTPNRRKPYDTADAELIFNHDIPDSELSALIGRSVAGIQIKRCNLKK